MKMNTYEVEKYTFSIETPVIDSTEGVWKSRGSTLAYETKNLSLPC